MAFKLPNLDRVLKENAPLAEALEKAQTYVNANVPSLPGNSVTAPPASLTGKTVPAGAPKIAPPPKSVVRITQ